MSNGRARRERSEPGYFVIALGCERVGQSVEPHARFVFRRSEDDRSVMPAVMPATG